MLELRDFDADLKAIFAKHKEPLQCKPQPKPFIDISIRRFNVEKETEEGRKLVEFGITITDAFRGLEGRFKNSDKAKYHVVPAFEE